MLGADEAARRSGSRTSATEVTLLERAQIWWTLTEVVEWVRVTAPNTSILDIRNAVEQRCASGRIRAHGRRRIYTFDRHPKISHTDPAFVQISEEYSYVRRAPEQISTAEWHDLAFFARPIRKAGEEYLIGFAQAFDRLDSPVELRSNSKHRLAWLDVEFLREDVAREWPHPACGAEYNATDRNTPGSPSGGGADGTAGLGLTTRRIAPVAERELRSWYLQRVSELTERNETSSGEQDWEAAKQQFPGRLTRARLRALREESAPQHWKKQGRRSALSGR